MLRKKAEASDRSFPEKAPRATSRDDVVNGTPVKFAARGRPSSFNKVRPGSWRAE